MESLVETILAIRVQKEQEAEQLIRDGLQHEPSYIFLLEEIRDTIVIMTAIAKRDLYMLKRIHGSTTSPLIYDTLTTYFENPYRNEEPL